MPKVPASVDACPDGQTAEALPAPQRHRYGRLDLRDRDNAARAVVRTFRDGSSDFCEGGDDSYVCHWIAPAGRRNTKLGDGDRSYLADDTTWPCGSNARAGQNRGRRDGNWLSVFGPAPLRGSKNVKT